MIPLLRDYQAGKQAYDGGRIMDKFGFKWFSYTDIFPGIFFGTAAFAQIYLFWIPMLSQIIDEGVLKDGVSWWAIPLALPFVFFAWLTYSLCSAFFFWLGVQSARFIRKKP